MEIILLKWFLFGLHCQHCKRNFTAQSHKIRYASIDNCQCNPFTIDCITLTSIQAALFPLEMDTVPYPIVDSQPKMFIFECLGTSKNAHSNLISWSTQYAVRFSDNCHLDWRRYLSNFITFWADIIDSPVRIQSINVTGIDYQMERKIDVMNAWLQRWTVCCQVQVPEVCCDMSLRCSESRHTRIFSIITYFEHVVRRQCIIKEKSAIDMIIIWCM